MSKKIEVNKETGIVRVLIHNKKVRAVGTARCNFADGDTFDEQKGIAIAEQRASLAFKKAQSAHYKKKMESFLKQADYFKLKIEGKQIEIENAKQQVSSVLDNI